MKRTDMKEIKVILCALLTQVIVFGISTDIFSQELNKVIPESVGMSSQRLELISSLLNGPVNESKLSGAVALVARKGEIAYLKSFGYLETEKRTEMPADAIFRLASMTKMITSVAVMVLYEEGHFRLSTPVSDFFPEFKEMEVAVKPEEGSSGPLITEPAKREITIRDLLRHTSGLTYSTGYPHLNGLYNEAGLDTESLEPFKGSLKDFIRQITSVPLAFHPGENWEYSYATDVLGCLVEKISGQNLSQFMKERIFDPLNMKDAGFVIDSKDLNRLPGLYQITDGKLDLVESAEESPFRFEPENYSGGGGWTDNGHYGLLSTAKDYAVILQMLLNKGEYNGNRILGKKTVELMLRNHLVDIPRNWLGPAVGFTLCAAKCTDIEKLGELGSEGHMWWAGSCNTFFFFDPEEELIGVLMTQMYPLDYMELLGKFKTFCYQAIEK